ncbi:hypothetical protein BO71DRAFT_481806 [Aspergillus ellipticus CBS 707.79]|uniref:L-ascorbate oxidase n=1 Tax=Aspergillus ellipticus CBS 707.79 TaxID=1448320 RepID=A0A319DGY0_9EURO|nr:hypothetical protein BO71DRAFT_481806 [Aspergillus ellipticus CBS 707.79]
MEANTLDVCSVGSITMQFIFQSRLAPLALGLVQWGSCRVVQFGLDLTWEDLEIAGVVRKTILSNGQFPGPPLRVKQGDEVEFLVNNSMPFGTTVHFHGISQQGTPWSDGVPGLSRTEIQPGDQFLYKWKANDYGAYIYHAHTNAQLIDGLYGPIYIEPEDSVERPFHLISKDLGSDELQAMRDAEKNTLPIILSDYQRFTGAEILQIEKDTGIDSFCVNSVLINGKGSVICPTQDHINAITSPQQRNILGNLTMTDMGCLPPILLRRLNPLHLDKAPPGFYKDCMPSEGPMEMFHVNSASQYVSYDLISMAGSLAMRFSIDEHPMYVYAVDGRYVEPTLVDALTIPIGSRYSVLVKLKSKSDQHAADYTIRVANKYTGQIINGTAVLSYDDVLTQNQKSSSRPSRPYITETADNATADAVFLDDNTVVPFPVVAPAAHADQTFILNVNRTNTSYTWILGTDSYSESNELLSPPVLFNRSSIPAQYAISTMNNTWVDLIINITTSRQIQHPIHKHSNKYFVIGSGVTPFTYSSVDEAMQYIPQDFNLKNPPMRDTFFTPSSRTSPSWLALRYFVQNPGPFLLHCHIQMHHSGGLALALLDGVDAWPTDIPEYQMPVRVNGTN